MHASPSPEQPGFVVPPVPPLDVVPPADVVPPLLAAGVRRYRIELVREGAASVLNLVSTYRRLLDRETDTTEAWRALRSDPATAVVRGSLRVLG